MVYEAITVWSGRWITNPEISDSKPLSESKEDSAVNPSEIDEMNIRNFLELSG